MISLTLLKLVSKLQRFLLFPDTQQLAVMLTIQEIFVECVYAERLWLGLVVCTVLSVSLFLFSIFLLIIILVRTCIFA